MVSPVVEELLESLDLEAAHYRNGTPVHTSRPDTLPPVPSARLETVTPQLAQAWLKTAHRNRSLSTARVKALASAIRRGLWTVNGQTIVLCHEGRLLDGQHRLSAVVEAGIAIQTMVVRGIDPEAFGSIDQGRKRLASDVLSIEGKPQPHTLASALRWLWRYENLSMMQATIALQDYELPAYLRQHQGLIPALTWGAQLAAFLPPGASSMLYYLLQKHDPCLAKQFYQALAKGAGLLASDPAYLAREKFLHEKRELHHQAVCQRAAVIVLAWNCVRSHTPMAASKLTWKGTGVQFPQVR